MIFADMPSGAAVFLDANTFVYHLISEQRYGPACTALLERVERHDIEGWVTPHVLAEVSHRLMTVEACALFGWPYHGIASRLRRHPQQIQQLTHFRDALDEIDRLSLHWTVPTEKHVLQTADVSRRQGLLTNDALLVVAMRSQGVTTLASNDADFDRVPGVTRYASG